MRAALVEYVWLVGPIQTSGVNDFDQGIFHVLLFNHLLKLQFYSYLGIWTA